MFVDADSLVAFGVPLLCRSARSSLRTAPALLAPRLHSRVEMSASLNGDEERNSLKVQRIRASKLYGPALQSKVIGSHAL